MWWEAFRGDKAVVIYSPVCRGHLLGPSSPTLQRRARLRFARTESCGQSQRPFVDLVPQHCHPGLYCLMGCPEASLSEGHTVQ